MIMNEPTIALGAMSLGILAVLVGLLVWGLKSGQFRDTEETKYQIFRPDKDTPDDRTSKS
jgi:cbb3-type cytochrome oxidase maturation protein